MDDPVAARRIASESKDVMGGDEMEEEPYEPDRASPMPRWCDECRDDDDGEPMPEADRRPNMSRRLTTAESSAGGSGGPTVALHSRN